MGCASATYGGATRRCWSRPTVRGTQRNTRERSGDHDISRSLWSGSRCGCVDGCQLGRHRQQAVVADALQRRLARDASALRIGSDFGEQSRAQGVSRARVRRCGSGRCCAGWRARRRDLRCRIIKRRRTSGRELLLLCYLWLSASRDRFGRGGTSTSQPRSPKRAS